MWKMRSAVFAWLTFCTGCHSPEPTAFSETDGGVDSTDPQADTTTRASDGGKKEEIVSQGSDAALTELACTGPLTFADEWLEGAVRSAIDVASGDIVAADVADLTSLEVGPGIARLDGIECLVALTDLDLEGGSIEDITLLNRLVNLESLHLSGNPIGNVEALRELGHLETLYLDFTGIRDVEPLSELTELAQLKVDHNDIEDISALSGLPNLAWLSVGDNPVEDLSVLSNMVSLKILEVTHLNLVDVPDLSSLPELFSLDLGGNELTAVGGVSDLTTLQVLDISGNAVSDISPLKQLNALVVLGFEFNNVSDVSPLLENSGIGDGDEVRMTGNPIDCADQAATIEALRDRGVFIGGTCP